MDLPSYWYRLAPLHLLLLPISWLFAGLVAMRRLGYRLGVLNSVRLPVPVVVVGNVTVGGTGKTPCTLALAQFLVQQGWRPVIVSRGYGGLARHAMLVKPGSAASMVGDEPLLMAQREICPVYIGRDRVAAAQLALTEYSNCNVILCDDGLQHYRLARDVEIAVVDVARGLGNGFLLPAGPLREPASRLQQVDVVVENGGKNMALSGQTFYNLLDKQRVATAAFFAQSRNHAIAGIGHPQRFFDSLQKLGIVSVNHEFADHHSYEAHDLNFESCDYILMTEKDAVKCLSFADPRCWVLRVDADLDKAIFQLILQKLESYGRQAA